MRRAGYLGALALLVASCTSPGVPAARYALVYGVSLYDPAKAEGQYNSPNLTWSDDDARDLAALLADQGYVVTERVNTEATRQNLATDLSTLAATLTPRDLVLVYYSGHGGMLSDFDTGAALDDETRWIFPYGSIDPDYTVHLDLAISDSDMAGLLSVLPVDRTVLILDSCNSGGFLRAGADVDAVPADYSALTRIDRAAILELAIRNYAGYNGRAAEKVYVLSAAGADEFSWEWDFLSQGVFTYFLLDSATEGDLNGDGWVTVLEAYAWAAAGLETLWNIGVEDPVYNPYYYYPHLSGGAVDFALFEVP